VLDGVASDPCGSRERAFGILGDGEFCCCRIGVQRIDGLDAAAAMRQGDETIGDIAAHHVGRTKRHRAPSAADQFTGNHGCRGKARADAGDADQAGFEGTEVDAFEFSPGSRETVGQ
jgi:hypothetical protein